MSEPSIRFSAVGDITLGDHPMCVGFGAYSRFRNEAPAFPFQHVSGILAESELNFGNLECAFSEHGFRRSDYHSVNMRGEPRLVTGLIDAGFHVLNIANNHSMQYGNQAIMDTAALLDRNGLAHCGLNEGNHLVGRPTVVERNGLRVAFLGYSLRPRQYFEHEPLYAEGTREGMLDDVRKARAQADIVVVSVHWGDEFIQKPSPEEIDLAHAVIDAGAQLIVGHHPHVLRGIERYGNGCIVYSLGNFVCDMVWDETLRATAIFQCTLTRDGIRDIAVVPARINDRFQPVPLTGAARDAALAAMESLPTEARSDMRQYALEADTVHRAIRMKSHMFFLTRIWKYPKRILVQQLGTFFRNRVHERLTR